MLNNFFWFAALMGEVALTFVLFRKGRWKQFPAFTALIAAPTLLTVALAPLRRLGTSSWYAPIYWTYTFLNILIQIAVVIELTRAVLRPTGTWVRDARHQFISWSMAGGTLALALAYLVSPPAPTALERFEFRANLFGSLLICELFLVVFSASKRLGLGWNNHVMAIGQGLTTWSTVAVIVDSVHSYYGRVRFYVGLDYLSDIVYLGALGYWCVQLWHEEPARQEISPELRNFIVALHRRVQYDLGKAE